MPNVDASYGPILSVSIHLKASASGSSPRVDVRFGMDRHRVSISQIQAYLFWNPSRRDPASWKEVVSVGFPRTMPLTTMFVDEPPETSLSLLFPLSPSVLSQMEESRPADKVHYGVALRLTGELIQQPVEALPAGQLPRTFPFVADMVPVCRTGASNAVLEIERSQWTDSLLPALGAGKWMVYEIPVENFEGVAQVDTYLSNAVKQFAAHEWKLCMAACRDVVESLERELQAAANPAYRDRFGSADKKMRTFTDSYGELLDALLGFEAASKSLLAAGAHPERPEELVERPDAELALWVALSLRRYVGMRIREGRPPSFSPPPPGGDGAA